MSIYNYKTSDGYKVAILVFSVLTFLYSLLDFVATLAVFDDPSLIWYSFLARLLILIIYLPLSLRVYYYYQYLGLFFILMSLPTILWSIMTIYVSMNIWFFIITISLYSYISWVFFTYNRDREFDYKEAAVRLLKDFPQKRISVNAHNVLLLSEIDTDNFSKLAIIKLLSSVPSWILFVLPPTAISFISSYVGINGLAIGMSSGSLFLCLIFSFYFSVSFRYVYVFKEAEKIINKREKT